MAYAYICVDCDHPLSRHLMVTGAELGDGPYRCGLCDCQVRGDAPAYNLSRRQYEAAFPELVVRG